MNYASLIVLVFIVACTPPPQPNPPPNFDASDAALFGDAPSACVQACAAMTAAGCVELPSCASTLASVESQRLVQNPANGKLPLACADLAAVKTAADVTARGWHCGP
jgi:hypothetical protein